MEKLADLFEPGSANNTLLKKVLYRLDVMIGGALDFLDRLSIFEIEIICESLQEF